MCTEGLFDPSYVGQADIPAEGWLMFYHVDDRPRGMIMRYWGDGLIVTPEPSQSVPNFMQLLAARHATVPFVIESTARAVARNPSAQTRPVSADIMRIDPRQQILLSDTKILHISKTPLCEPPTSEGVHYIEFSRDGMNSHTRACGRYGLNELLTDLYLNFGLNDSEKNRFGTTFGPLIANVI